MQLMIDPANPDHAAALAHNNAARRHAEDAIEAKQAARFYAGTLEPGTRYRISPADAATRVEMCLADEVKHTIAESKDLARLNAVLLHSGASVGSEYLIGRSVYRVSRPGQLAVYLGEQIPTDELHRHYEGLDNAADDVAERRSEYADSIRVTH